MSNTQSEAQGQEQPTEQDLKDLGSAEANAWTITTPGGEPMSLDQHAQQQSARDAQRQQHLQTMREEMESEAAIRNAAS